MTNYDTLVDTYPVTATLPIRPHVERHTFLKVLGDVTGQAFLDVACGDGTYARALKQMGALRVVGVDASEAMIRAARDIEGRSHLGIEYLVHDARGLPVLSGFDAVTAVYLLHYAETRQDLCRMCQGISENLRTDGRFVTVVMNPAFDARLPNCDKYGFAVRYPESPHDGDAASIEFHTDPRFAIHFHYWSRASYEEALRGAGFGEIVWTPLEPSPEGEASFGREFWQDCLDNPYATVLSCRKVSSAEGAVRRAA